MSTKYAVAFRLLGQKKVGWLTKDYPKKHISKIQYYNNILEIPHHDIEQKGFRAVFSIGDIARVWKHDHGKDISKEYDVINVEEARLFVMNDQDHEQIMIQVCDPEYAWEKVI